MDPVHKLQKLLEKYLTTYGTVALDLTLKNYIFFGQNKNPTLKFKFESTILTSCNLPA